LGLGYEEGRESFLINQPNCARIYEEEFLISIYDLVYQSVTHNNAIINTTTSTDGTTSAPSTLSASPDIRK